MTLSVPRATPRRAFIATVLTLMTLSSLTVPTLAASDPGPRALPPAAGGPLTGLSNDQLRFFRSAGQVFREIDSVVGDVDGEPGIGLGPRFNLNSCAGCHAYPALGGTSPPINPQIAVATLRGARNTVPSFLSASGPVRVARFVRQADGSLDGGVHELFVISGRSDAGGCAITQPDFAGELAKNNVIFRIPTPVFGAGLIEAVPDANLLATFDANAALRDRYGVKGRFNRDGHDGTISRFGWKAQNKSLLMFAGEAYSVEQGVSNELFPNERDTTSGCVFNQSPEDGTRLGAIEDTPRGRGSRASELSSDVVNLAGFMRMLAAPDRGQVTPAAQRGRAVFDNVGCQACHTASQTTGPSALGGQSGVAFQPFSDFALHTMGSNLADGVEQGLARGDEFRTAPLWGLGQRLFFLHDGRTDDLVQAVGAHAGPGSEANAVIAAFNGLADNQKQDLLAFLRSL